MGEKLELEVKYDLEISATPQEFVESLKFASLHIEEKVRLKEFKIVRKVFMKILKEMLTNKAGLLFEDD